MRKRITAMLLAMILLFTAESEVIYAVEQTEVSEYGETLQTEYSTVKFETDGGTPIADRQIQNGDCLDGDLIPTPEKIGYLFGGWTWHNGIAYDFSTPVEDNLTLIAEWTPITYQIQFNGNGGTGSMSAIKCTYDKSVTLPKNQFYKKGYIFEGWKLDGIGEYGDEGTVKNLSSTDNATLTLKAIWRVGNYKIRFHPNGGTGSMKDQVFSYTSNKNLYSNKYKRKGYTFAGWNTKQDGSGITYQNKQQVKALSAKDGTVITLYAMWSGKPYQVHYDGNGATKGSMSDSSHIYGTNSRLRNNSYSKKGYAFAGWNTKRDGSGTTYKNMALVKDLTATKNKTVVLYAKWKAVKYKITYYKGGGKLPKSYKATYTIETKTFTLPKPTKKGYDFDGWYTDKTYKKRVDTVKQGRTGKLILYAKWVKCSRKAKSDSAKITYCNATGKDRIRVKATIKKRVASSDDYYYLVYTNPNSKKPYKMAARAYKKKYIAFTLRPSKNQGYALANYKIAIRKNGKYQAISSLAYIKNPERAAKNKSSYRLGKTKKGIQFSQSTEELYSCGAQNTFLNVTTSMVCNGSVPYEYNGKTYYFQSMNAYKNIVSECNRKKINVSMQILLDWTGNNTDLIASKARVLGAAPFYTWNTSSNASREKMEAIFCYLGEIFGQKNCYVSNWILGNEINNHNSWNYKGSMSTTAYFKSYAIAFRQLYYAVKSQYSNARVFICMDYMWNTSQNGGYSVKSSIAYFDKELKKIQKGVKWNLAYHAYSHPLTYTRVWDGYGIAHDEDTPYVTPSNLHVLTQYIKKHYGSSTRIILSEQGFSSTWGEKEQAAAIAYSYYMAACDPMVDAFIIRSYDDHPVEVAQGLCMGISGKQSFKVFKYMDTRKSSKYTKKYLKLIGVKSWKQAISGYKYSRVWKMYRRG